MPAGKQKLQLGVRSFLFLYQGDEVDIAYPDCLFVCFFFFKSIRVFLSRIPTHWPITMSLRQVWYNSNSRSAEDERNECR